MKPEAESKYSYMIGKCVSVEQVCARCASMRTMFEGGHDVRGGVRHTKMCTMYEDVQDVRECVGCARMCTLCKDVYNVQVRDHIAVIHGNRILAQVASTQSRSPATSLSCLKWPGP